MIKFKQLCFIITKTVNLLLKHAEHQHAALIMHMMKCETNKIPEKLQLHLHVAVLLFSDAKKKQ